MLYERPETIRRLLRILEDRGGRAHVRAIAQDFWPKSALWNRPARRPNAAGHLEYGVALHSQAGALCGRLRRLGYAQRGDEPGVWEITEKGRDMLYGPAPVLAPVPQLPAPAPMPKVPTRPGWVQAPDGRWFQAAIGPALGNGVWVFWGGQWFLVPHGCVA